jgi:hypothetical protein
LVSDEEASSAARITGRAMVTIKTLSEGSNAPESRI